MFKIVYAFPVLAALSFFAISSYTNRNTIVIQSVSVPDRIEEQGYNPRVVTSLLEDTLEDILRAAGTNRGNLLSDNSAEATNIDALSDGFGFAKPIQASQIALGLLDYVFNADLLQDGDYLILRIDGQSKKYWGFEVERRRSDGDIRALILETAIELMQEIDPYVVAVYHFRTEIKTEDFTNTKLAIDHAMVHAPRDQLNWVYALLAHVLFFEGDYDGSIQKNQQAFKLNETFPRPLMRWGENLAAMGKHKEAIVRYKEVLEMDASYSEALVYWGRSLIAMEDITGAEIKFRTAYEMAPDFARIVREYGMFHAKYGDKVRAQALLRHAVTLSDGENEKYIHDFRKLQRELDPAIESVVPLIAESVDRGRTQYSGNNLD